MTFDPKKQRLGRGLESLLPPPAAPKPGMLAAPIEEIYPNREQPRTRFDETGLEELAQSIRENGLLEPILVRKRPAGGFEIVAGERRWRAAQRAGLREVPIFVRELSTQAAYEAAIVENVQREDLNAIEIARAFFRLVEEFGHSQETVAQKVGKDRSTVANALRLLKLPPPVLEQIENGALSEGHGRALLQAEKTERMLELSIRAVREGWSVRDTERAARGGDTTTPKKAKSANIRDLESRLSKSLGSRVEVDDVDGKGTLHIRYTSLAELDRLLDKLL